MPYKEFEEGKVKIRIPASKRSVFFNPEAEVTRDISVAALSVFADSYGKVSVCDALAATGIRGIRYAKEAKSIRSVTVNDKNPVSVRAIKDNIKLNATQKKCKAVKGDASLLLRENIFTAIDIDPFGSPAEFMDSAAKSIHHKGFLMVTATDTGALSGFFPDAAMRKYGIRAMETEFYPELGLRVLATFIIQSLSRYDKAFMPLLSFSRGHYMRVMGKVEHAGQLQHLMGKISILLYCKGCGSREIGSIKEQCPICKSLYFWCGPLYTGSMTDKKFATEVRKDLKGRKFRLAKDEDKLMQLIVDEASQPPLYYDFHILAKRLGLKVIRTEELERRLRKKGFSFSRTHLNPNGFRTDAALQEIISLLRS